MIRYALVCDRGHGFETWFRNADAYDEQEQRDLLSCPSCGSAKVGKALMAPSVGRKGDAEPPAASGQHVVMTSPTMTARAMMSPAEAEIRAKLRELRDHLTAHSDYVGKSFADEARRIHFGESEHRSIHGEASAEEARALMDDGVEVHPLPNLPDDLN